MSQVVKRPLKRKEASHDVTQTLWHNGKKVSSSDYEIWRSVSEAQGYNLSNFKKLKLQGRLIPMTPWKQWSSSGLGRPSTYKVVYQGNDTWYRTNYVLGAVLGSMAMDATTAESYILAAGVSAMPYVSKSAATIYGSGMDMLTFVVELKSTLKMIFRAFKRLTGLLRERRNIGDDWLELRYGWRPLISDIRAIAEALNALNETRTRFTQRSGSSTSKTYKDSVFYTSPYYDYNVVTTTIVNVSVRGTVAADIEPPIFRFDPINTAWELIRFSFIIDWFIDIGGWINTMRFMQHHSKYYASAGYKVTITRDCQLELVAMHPPVISATLGGTCRSDLSYVVRSPCSIPVLPTQGSGLNLLKGFDLVAILRQILSKRR